jgi:hypothetical protein
MSENIRNRFHVTDGTKVEDRWRSGGEREEIVDNDEAMVTVTGGNRWW